MEAAMQRYQYPFSFVHARQETEFINPLPLGKPAQITTKIVDKYVKRDKGYIVIESLIVDLAARRKDRYKVYSIYFAGGCCHRQRCRKRED
jgi:hypothetical protein